MKKYIAIFLVSLSVLSLVSCGNNADTGVIVTANDSGKNNSSDKIFGDVETEDASSESITETETDSDDDTTEETKTFVGVVGTWMSNDGVILTLKSDNKASLMDMSIAAKELYGTYETDEKSYIKFTETPLQPETLFNEDGTVAEASPTPDPKVIDFKIDELKNGESMKLTYNSTVHTFNFNELIEEETNKADSSASATPEKVLEPGQLIDTEHYADGMTPEDKALYDKTLIENGIDPTTGKHVDGWIPPEAVEDDTSTEQ